VISNESFFPEGGLRFVLGLCGCRGTARRGATATLEFTSQAGRRRNLVNARSLASGFTARGQRLLFYFQ